MNTSAIFLTGSSGVGKSTLCEVLLKGFFLRLVKVRARDVHSTIPKFSYADVIASTDARVAAQDEVFARFRETIHGVLSAPDPTLTYQPGSRMTHEPIPLFERTLLDVVAYSLVMRPLPALEAGLAALRAYSPYLSGPGSALGAFVQAALDTQEEKEWVYGQITNARKFTLDTFRDRVSSIYLIPLPPAHVPYDQEGSIRPDLVYRNAMAEVLPYLYDVYGYQDFKPTTITGIDYPAAQVQHLRSGSINDYVNTLLPALRQAGVIVPYDDA